MRDIIGVKDYIYSQSDVAPKRSLYFLCVFFKKNSYADDVVPSTAFLAIALIYTSKKGTCLARPKNKHK